MNSNDPLPQVVAYRPTPADIEREWPAARQAAVLDRVMSTGDQAPIAAKGAPAPGGRTTTRRRGFHRGLIPVTLVAAVVAVLLLGQFLIPAGNPGGPTGAAALDRLATAASEGDSLQPGQFRHEVVNSAQNGAVMVVQESWTSADGHVWRHDSAGGDSRFYAFPPGGDDINGPSPAFLAGLPTGPAELNSYLRANVHGSNSTDEAVFVAVGDMLRGGFAPPALRAAALKVLKLTPHVTVEDSRDSLGRKVVQVTFIDQVSRPDLTKSLLFDPDTAAVLESQTATPDLTYSGTVTDQDIVGAVPDGMLAGVARQEADPSTAPMAIPGGESILAQPGSTTATSVSQTALSTRSTR